MPLSVAQATIANDPARFRVVVAGRRFGKTHLSIRELAYAARNPNKEIWYVAPTYRQAKQIVWKKLKNKLQDLNWVQRVNESELSITLKNSSTISLKGADNPDSLRGVGLDFLVMDEFADVTETAWTEVLRPTLADSNKLGRALFIGTPKGVGNWAHDLYFKAEQLDNWSSYQFTTLEGGNVTAEELSQARQDLDERQFRQEFMATFETYTGRIYYAFDRKINVKPITFDTPPTAFHIGIDFNIDPMSAVVFVKQGDVLYAIDEIRLFSSNTNELVDEIKSRYRTGKIYCYPDPSGRARKTSAAGATDFAILENAGFVVKAPRAHTPVRDRINAVNSRLKSAANQIYLYIDSKCKYTIEGLERHTYQEGTSQPDKHSGYDHQMDAMGYCVDYLFPINKDHSMVQQPTRWGHQIG